MWLKIDFKTVQRAFLTEHFHLNKRYTVNQSYTKTSLFRSLLLAAFFLSLSTGIVNATKYYVGTSGSDGNSTTLAQSSSTPWATVVFAISQAATGDSIVVLPGTYSEANVSITKSLKLFGNETGGTPGVGTKPVFNGSSPTANGCIFRVQSTNVVIQNFEIQVDQNLTFAGIFASAGGFNGLKIANNHIFSLRPSVSSVFASYGIILGQTVSTAGNDSSLIVGNLIKPLGPGIAKFGRGIRLNGGYSTIGGFAAADTNYIYGDYGVQCGSALGTVRVINNRILAISAGVELNIPMSNRTHKISGNRITPIPGNVSLSMIEIKNNTRGGSVIEIEDNTFTGHEYSAILSTRSRNVFVRNNIFTPSDTAHVFSHILVNTKQQTSSTTETATNSSISITGNTFNANTFSAGRGIVFENHFSGANPPFTDVVVGGAGALANRFAPNLKQFVALDSASGSSKRLPLWDQVNVLSSNMLPVEVDLDISQNLYDVGTGAKTPSSMSTAELMNLENRLQHQIDFDSLGFLTVVPNTAFITASSFVSPKTTTPSLQRAFDAASSDNWTVVAEPIVYTDNLDVTKTITLDAEPSNEITIQSLSMNGAGKTLSLIDPVRLAEGIDLTDGFVQLAGSDLSLNPSPAFTFGSNTSYVKTTGSGKFVHRLLTGSNFFPVGTATSYLPVSLNNSGAADNIGVRVQNDVLSGGLTGSPVDSVVGSTWVINEAVAGGSNLSVTPSWNGSDEKPQFTRTLTTLQGFQNGAWANIAGNSQVAATGPDPYQATYSPITTNLTELPVRIRNFSKSGSLFYVDNATGLDSRTPDQAKNPSTPWKTIGQALASVDNGDSVQVFAGTYSESNLAITKGVNLFGNVLGIGVGAGAGTGVRPVVNGSSIATDSAIFAIKSTNVLIRNFQIVVNQADIISGISAKTAGYNNLIILDNLIQSAGLNPGPAVLPCLDFNTYGIRLVGFQTEKLTIQRNIIQPSVLDGTRCVFGRGIKLFGGHGLIGGPLEADSNRILCYYSIQAGDVDGGLLQVQNNYLNGIGMQIVAPAANSGEHIVSNNRFVVVSFPQFFPTQFELKDVQKAGTGVKVSKNTFDGFSNTGIFVQRAKNVIIDNNTFQPVDTATNFRSVVVNTKQETTASNQPPVTSGAIVKGNTFLPSSIDGAGTAIEFGNHNDDPTSATAFTGVQIGGSGSDANFFSQKIGKWFVLDPLSGPTSSIPYWSGLPSTTMAPVADNFDLKENIFSVSSGPKRPAEMSTSELYVLEDKIQHGIDVATLGFVTVKDNQAFVTSNSLLAPFTTAPSLQRAHDKVTDGASVFSEAISIPEVTTISKSLTLDANPSGRIQLNGLKMQGAGKELSLTDSLLIADSLDMNAGIVNLGSGSIVLSGTAINQGGSSTSFVRTTGSGQFIHKTQAATAKNYPVGIGSTYLPLSLTNSGTSDDLGVRVADGVLEGSAQVDTVVGATWTVNEAVTGGSDLQATFGWPGSKERTGFDRASVFVDRLTGLNWTNLSGATPLVSTGSDPYSLTANLNTDFDFTQLRLTSTLKVENAATLYYVDDDSGNDSRTNAEATNPNTPWKTIGKALASVSDGDSVQVFEGIYSENNLEINKKIKLYGSVIGIGVGVGAGNGNKPVVDGIASGADSTVFSIRSTEVEINNFQIEVNQTSVLHGIYARNGNFNNSKFLNLLVLSTGTNVVPGIPCVRFNTYGMRFLNGGNDSAIVKGCFIQPKNFNANCAFGRGIRTFSGGRFIIGGPANADTNRIVAFYGVQMGDLAGPTVVEHNSFAGQGVEITAPDLNSGIHKVIQNRFFAVIPQAFIALIELKDVQKNGTGVLIENNIISGHSNFGIFSERSRNVTVRNNLFIPSDTAKNFRHISVNTKQQTAATVQVPGVNSITIQGNEFRSASSTAGIGVEFGNHNDDPAAVNAFTGVTLGGALADANTFGGNLRYFFRLDPQTGPSNTILPWTNFPVTPMSPVADAFDVTENVFTVSGGQKRPATMTDTELYELEDKVLHAIDYDSLGFVTSKPSFAAVTNNSFILPYSTAPSLQRAVDAAGTNDGWQVNIEPAQINEDVLVTKAMTWNAFPADSVRLAGIEMNGAGKILTLSDNFILTTSLKLSNVDGGFIDIGNNDLDILPSATVTQGSANSYVRTTGTGSFVHRTDDGTAKTFPIGTVDSYAPVEFDDANPTGDNIRARVNPAPTAADFTPALPASITTFVKFQWTICEDVAGGSDAVLRFDWSDPLNVFGAGSINSISRFDGTNWSTSLATIGPGLVASGFNFNAFCSPFAVVAAPNLTEIITGNIIKIGPGVSGRFCPGDSVKIPFTVNGDGIVVGNNFNAFLSNPDGTFPVTGGVLMGSLQGNTSDTLKGKIPLSAVAGINYRVRVVSDNVQIIGSSNPDSIKIFELPVRPVITGDTALCFGESTTLTSSASTSYSWNPGSSNGQSLSVSTAGAYSVQITDNNGCTNRSAVANVAIFASPVAEAITFTGALIRCADDSVTLTANPPGFNYAWLNTTPVVNTRDLKVKASGTYSVIITNADGCSDTSATVTTVFNALPAKPVITSPNISVCQPASLEFSTDAGFTYDWAITSITPNPSTQTVTINNPGSYDARVTITDANNCKNTSDLFSGTLKKAPLLPSLVTNAGDLSVCEGSSIIIKPQPFSGASNYTWSPGALVADSFIVNTPGAVSVSVAVDSNGCAAIGSASLAVNVNARPATPTITITQGSASFCSGDSATLSSSSAFGYVWTPGGLTTQTLIANATGLYSVVTLSDSGCASLPSAQISIDSRKIPEKPLVSATKTIFCFGDNSILSVTNAGLGNTYTWTPSGSGSTLTVTASGSYSVKSDSANGCSNTSDAVAILVNALPEPVITTSEADNRVCLGDSVVLTSNFENGNVWSGVSGSPTTQSIVLSTTTSAITLKVTDGNGCSSTVGPVSVKVDTLPVVTLEKDTALVVKETFDLKATGFPANRQKFDWYKGGLFIGTTNGSDPSFEIIANNTSNYSVLITDSNGCTGSDSVLIRVSNELFVPNSFSPNKDGRNDRFKVYGYGVATIQVQVWDRLGNLIYETNKVEDIVETSEEDDSAIGWDGTYKGKEVSQESYIWKVSGTFQTGEPVRVFGGNNSGSVIILN